MVVVVTAMASVEEVGAHTGVACGWGGRRRRPRMMVQALRRHTVTRRVGWLANEGGGDAFGWPLACDGDADGGGIDAHTMGKWR